jgi:hypothetical protein
MNYASGLPGHIAYFYTGTYELQNVVERRNVEVESKQGFWLIP